MDREQAILLKISEECAEVAQRASKAMRFGLDEVGPGHTHNNAIMLADEVADLITAISILCEENKLVSDKIDMFLKHEDDFCKRYDKLDKFMLYSQKLGKVEWQQPNSNQSTQTDSSPQPTT